MVASYRYNASVNFTDGRCPGSKAIVFDNYKQRRDVTVQNVNIEDCDFTIAFWIRSAQWLLGSYVRIWGSSRFGKRLFLHVSSHAECVYYHGFSNIVMNNWTHYSNL